MVIQEHQGQYIKGSDRGNKAELPREGGTTERKPGREVAREGEGLCESWGQVRQVLGKVSDKHRGVVSKGMYEVYGMGEGERWG